MFKPLVLIPVFNHELAVVATVESVLQQGLPLLLIDDGSGPACERVLQQLAQTHAPSVRLHRLATNAGKGAAIKAGLLQAQQLGYSHALQLDADGQHESDDIPNFLAAAQQQPQVLVAGCPLYDASVPKLRFYGRYLTHVWVWINTLSLSIKDTMCGFRVYPVAPSVALIKRQAMGNRMEFDSEMMVHWFWQGGAVINIPTRVKYPPGGVSHFHALRDNWLITKMHTRLFFGMLLRLPRLLGRKFNG